MRNELPAFRKVRRRYAASIVHNALSGPSGSALLQLIEYDDHHFRAVFNLTYFQLAAGSSLPSKSQWDTLKKKLKRRERSIFIFREYGTVDCHARKKATTADTCLYLDFGFRLL